MAFGTAPRQPIDMFAGMEDWPRSWAGSDADLPLGTQLAALFRSFLLHLQEGKLAPRTLRRHRDNLWLLGGEIIRKLHFDPPLRRKSGRAILIEAIKGGEAPWVRDLTESEQNALDATARKLLRFLLAAERRLPT